MFGHFLSTDFARTGIKSIMNHINQREIAEKLLGNFLLNATFYWRIFTSK
jgi:hypothetical protein